MNTPLPAHIRLSLSALLLAAVLGSAAADEREGTPTVGTRLEHLGKQAGRGIEKASKSVAKGLEVAAKKTGQGLQQAGKGVKKGVQHAGKAIDKAVDKTQGQTRGK